MHLSVRVRRAVTVVVLALAGAAVATAAEEMPVPPAVQAAMFSKIFPFVRTLDRQEVHIVIVYAPEQKSDRAGAVGALRQGFHDVGLDAEGIGADELPHSIGKAKVAYLFPGATTPAVLDAIASAKVLSISGAPSLAEGGAVSIAIGARANKPEILVNPQRLKVEGQEISSQLMPMARVVGG
jgi:hypothetical protein